MNSPMYRLLQNEGHLFQGCFKSSIVALRRGQSADRGRYYAASFNFAIGLERLLKVLLILDNWRRERCLPNSQEIRRHGRKSGHDIERLYAAVKELFAVYRVSCPAGFEPDDLDLDLLSYFSDFAKMSRYFNLDMLFEEFKGEDPLARWNKLILDVYLRDLPRLQRIHDEDELDAMAERIEGNVYHMPNKGMTGESLSFREMVQDNSRVARALSPMCLRFLKLLIPLKELLIRVRERIHEDDDHTQSATVPYMEEFLDFVCTDRTIVDEAPDDWP